MGGVDRMDRQLWVFMQTHRSLKWWKKLFMYLLELVFCQFKVVWHAAHSRGRRSSKLRLIIIHGLLAGHSRSAQKGGRKPAQLADKPARLIDGHFPSLNPHKKQNGKANHIDCVVCSSRDTGAKRCATQFYCSVCEVALHPYPCFQRYHTLVNYKIKCVPGLHS